MKKKLAGQLGKQSGQATMEAVLIMLVVVTVATKITSYAQDTGVLQKVVEGPWSPMRGMIEDGVWMRHTLSKPYHPNQFPRHQSRQGDET
ncbi:MAG: hypothetical protein U1E10_09910 [Bdellovibrionales bacterium]|nr:hypothetical protein [Bdellovibrionales bacterium]